MPAAGVVGGCLPSQPQEAPEASRQRTRKRTGPGQAEHSDATRSIRKGRSLPEIPAAPGSFAQ
jgi:hypothetical protein